MHCVVLEHALIHISFGCDGPAKPIELAPIEAPFKNGVAWVNLKSDTVRFGRIHVALASIHRSTLPVVPVKPHDSLSVEVLV